MATVDQAARDAAGADAPPQCAGICSDSNGFHRWQCHRRGYALSADGKHYCKQHHPETIAKRRQERDLKWKREMEERDRALAEVEARQRELGIGEATIDGALMLSREEVAVLTEFLTSGDVSIRDAWRRTLVTFEVQRSRRVRANA